MDDEKRLTVKELEEEYAPKVEEVKEKSRSLEKRLRKGGGTVSKEVRKRLLEEAERSS